MNQNKALLNKVSAYLREKAQKPVFSKDESGDLVHNLQIEEDTLLTVNKTKNSLMIKKGETLVYYFCYQGDLFEGFKDLSPDEEIIEGVYLKLKEIIA